MSKGSRTMLSGQSSSDYKWNWNGPYWKTHPKAQWIKYDENGNFSICEGPVPPDYIEVEIPGLDGSSKLKHGRLIAEAKWRARAKMEEIDKAAKRVVKL